MARVPSAMRIGSRLYGTDVRLIDQERLLILGRDLPVERRRSLAARVDLVSSNRVDGLQSLVIVPKPSLADWREEDLGIARRVLPVFSPSGRDLTGATSPSLDRFLIRLSEASDVSDLGRFADLGLCQKRILSSLVAPFVWFELEKPALREDDWERVFQLKERLERMEGVESVELDWIRFQGFHSEPSDPLFSAQWNLRAIELPSDWTIEQGREDIWIAVIDDGVDVGHTDLRVTPNRNGAYSHFDFAAALREEPPPYTIACPGDHGTAVAGIAAARLGNGEGIGGVAGGCSILPVCLGSADPAGLSAGIGWAIDHGARVINVSYGVDAPEYLEVMIRRAAAAGVVVCASTGNHEGSPVEFPARFASVLGVGASDCRGMRHQDPGSPDGETWGSQFGQGLDVVAPGVLCWTTDVRGEGGNVGANGVTVMGGKVYGKAEFQRGDYLRVFSGTSAAAPHVSGLAGLLLSRLPNMTDWQVREAIKSSCTKVTGGGAYSYAIRDRDHPEQTWNEEVGFGLINCKEALLYAQRKFGRQRIRDVVARWLRNLVR